MNSELLYNSSSFDWLAKEIRRGQARRKNGSENHRNEQIRDQLGVPRVPVDFSPEAAMLKARHLRALKFGEWLGNGARRVVQAIESLAARLNGNTRDSERVKRFLAKEIRRGQARRKNGGEDHRDGQIRDQLGVPRLPVGFSPEAAMLKARHLRALYFGELLGKGARTLVRAIKTLAARLNGGTRLNGSTGDSEWVKRFEEHRKAA